MATRQRAATSRAEPREIATTLDRARNGESEQQVVLDGLRSLRRGDFGVRLPPGVTAADSELSDAFNEVAALNERMSRELRRMSRIVGRHGQMGARASIQGAGVGLAGARDIVEQHGGSIEVASVEDETTTFTVRLPAAVAA